MEFFRLLLKLGAVDNIRQVMQESFVIHLFIEIARVNLESGRESSSRVAMTEIQQAIGLTCIFAIWHLGGDIPDAIVLDVFHEQTITYKNAIDVE
jgi:hypothetical protein